MVVWIGLLYLWPMERRPTRRTISRLRNMTFSKLPPAYPELNPVERVFLEVRRGLKSRVFATLKQAQARVKEVLEELVSTSGRIVSLVWLVFLT